jgi:hypothetical protein
LFSLNPPLPQLTPVLLRGLSWNKMIEGTQVVGDDVEIDLHVEADKE